LDDDVLQFLSSMEHDRSIMEYDILGSEAHSIMLHEIGLITRKDLQKILTALDTARKKGAVRTEGYEDIHEAVEAFVIKKAGMESGGKMHSARSRNDQVALDIRMKLRDDANNICAALADLIEGLAEKAEDSKTAAMPMYTHLQQGQLGTFSHYLLSYASSLLRDMERLYLCYQRLNQSPLGACAIGGSSIPIDRKRTAVLLGFDSLVVNSIDATSSRDVFLEFAAILSIMTSSLSRLAEDFIIWSTTEFGYIELADRFSSTSSAMPQKKNPDPLELVRAKSAIVTSHFVAMSGIVKALPSGYSRDLQDLKPQLFESSATSLGILKIMNGVIRSLQINRERMKAAAKSSYAISLDIAEQFVLKNKIPFREAHKIVGGLVDRAASKGMPLSGLSNEEIGRVLDSLSSTIDSKTVAAAIGGMSPEKSIQSRRTKGSPSLVEQEEMIKSTVQAVRNYKQGIQKRIKMVEGGYKNLGREIARYQGS
jgi:argininosuccinate lyase